MSLDYEEYLIWERSRNSPFSKLKKYIKWYHYLMIILFLAFIYYLLEYQKVDAKILVSFEGIIIAIIIARILSAPTQKVIPENVIKIIAKRALERKIGNGGEFPQGTQIEPLAYCRLRYMGEWGSDYVPWKWEVGFKVIYPNGLKKDIVVIMHVYEGYITGIKEVPEGYTGQQSKDLKVLIPSQIVQKESPATNLQQG